MKTLYVVHGLADNASLVARRAMHPEHVGVLALCLPACTMPQISVRRITNWFIGEFYENSVCRTRSCWQRATCRTQSNAPRARWSPRPAPLRLHHGRHLCQEDRSLSHWKFMKTQVIVHCLLTKCHLSHAEHPKHVGVLALCLPACTMGEKWYILSIFTLSLSSRREKGCFVNDVNENSTCRRRSCWQRTTCRTPSNAPRAHWSPRPAPPCLHHGRNLCQEDEELTYWWVLWKL